MSKDFLKYFLKKFHSSIQFFFILGIFCLITDQAWSQKKQLAASTRVVKVAFIDHSRLRKEFKNYAAAKEKLAIENNADKKAFEIELLSTTNRSEITDKYQLKQKKRNRDRISIMQEYELTITTAIDAVVSDGGFTEVKPLVKDLSNQRSVDITDLILKKLN